MTEHSSTGSVEAQGCETPVADHLMAISDDLRLPGTRLILENNEGFWSRSVGNPDVLRALADLLSRHAQTAPQPAERAAIIDNITNITTWLREPDWIEQASLEWLMDWMNRRPIADLAMVAMLLPGPALPSTSSGTEPSAPATSEDRRNG